MGNEVLKELMVVPCAIVQTQDSSRTTFLVCKVADFCYPDNALQQGMYFNGHFACGYWQRVMAVARKSAPVTFSFQRHAGSRP